MKTCLEGIETFAGQRNKLYFSTSCRNENLLRGYWDPWLRFLEVRRLSVGMKTWLEGIETPQGFPRNWRQQSFGIKTWLEGMKRKTRNTKHEVRDKFKILISKIQNKSHPGPLNSFLFRISIFVLRISPLGEIRIVRLGSLNIPIEIIQFLW